MAIPLTNSAPLSGDSFIDGLVQGGKWSSGNLTYSVWDNIYGTWDSNSRLILDTALEQFENVANITFQFEETYGYRSLSSDLTVGFSGDLQETYVGSLALGIFPDVNIGNAALQVLGSNRSDTPNIEGTIFLDNYQSPFQYGSAPGGYGFSIIIHEIGHALGLKHPHDDGGNNRPEFSEIGMSGFDNILYTIMSYNPLAGTTITAYNPATPMPLDILALQYIYGANTSYNNGNDIYTITNASDSGVVQTLWDAGGVDLIDGRAVTLDIIFDLRGGEWSQVGNTYGAIAYNTIIENAYGGGGNDFIIGNAANNILKGFNGNDEIYGNNGDDWINGNAGMDVLLGEAGNDIVRGGRNTDTVGGGDGNDFLNGNNDADIVSGGAGNDTVHGGKSDDYIIGGSGSDLMYGDLGNDTMEGGSGVDVFMFKANSGVDTITDFVTGTDILQIDSSIFATAAQAVASFSGGVLDLSSGNIVTLMGVNSLSEGDFLIV